MKALLCYALLTVVLVALPDIPQVRVGDAQIKPAPVQPELGPQVVFDVLHTEKETRYVAPVGKVVFSLVPVSGPSAHAPLSQGDHMICRMFVLIDEQGFNHVGLRCGSDTFAVKEVWVTP
jgi:hypothetical protein